MKAATPVVSYELIQGTLRKQGFRGVAVRLKLKALRADTYPLWWPSRDYIIFIQCHHSD